MRRYFFNLTNGIRTVVDADGVQLEDEEAVRLEALEMVADLREEIAYYRYGLEWVVRDRPGRERLRVF
jgi:hypothetical protein